MGSQSPEPNFLSQWFSTGFAFFAEEEFYGIKRRNSFFYPRASLCRTFSVPDSQIFFKVKNAAVGQGDILDQEYFSELYEKIYPKCDFFRDLSKK